MSPRDQGSLINPNFKLPIIEKPPDDLNTSAREKWVIRHTPIVNSKYVPVWKRVRAKLRTRTMLSSLNREILLFGTNLHKGDDIDDVLSQQIETLVRRKTTKVIKEEEPEEEKLEPWLLHPRSSFRTFWNILIIILLIYTATVMPFHMAFAIEEDEALSWKVIDWMLDSLFMLDVIITCFSSYYNDEGRLITSHREIFFTYLRTWMLLDISGCIPIDLLVGNTSSKSSKYNSLLRLARLPRLYRLTRLARLLKMCKAGQGSELIERVQDFLSIKHTAARLLSFFTTVFLCVHLMSCMWYFVAKTEDFTPDTWVVYRGFRDDDVLSLYIASVYWAFTTLCTVGYGDITATTNAERIVAVVWMMFGVYFFSFTIGSLSTILSSIDTKETILTTKLAIVDEFVREAKLDRGMRNRLRMAIKYNAEKEGYSIADKQDIFYELPKGLRHEVALVMHQGVVKELSFFTEKDPVFVSSVVPFLKHLFVKSGSHVYREGDYADELYFIVRGWCGLVYGREGYLVKKFQRGSYFGEIEVIEAVPRKYTVVAAVDTDLLTMGKKLLSTIQQDFPSVYKEMCDVAEMRDKLNQKAIIEHKELLKMKKDENIEDMGIRDIKESIQLRVNKKIEKQHSTANSPKSAAASVVGKESDLVKQVVENEGRIAALEKEIDAIYKLVSDQSQMIMGIFGKRVGSVSPAKRGMSLEVPGEKEEK